MEGLSLARRDMGSGALRAALHGAWTHPRLGSGWRRAGHSSSGSAMGPGGASGGPRSRLVLAALSQPPPSAPSGTAFSGVHPAAEETPVLQKLAASPPPAQLMICAACQALVFFRDGASSRALYIRGALWSQGKVLASQECPPHPLALGQLRGLC